MCSIAGYWELFVGKRSEIFTSYIAQNITRINPTLYFSLHLFTCFNNKQKHRIF